MQTRPLLQSSESFIKINVVLSCCLTSAMTLVMLALFYLNKFFPLASNDIVIECSHWLESDISYNS